MLGMFDIDLAGKKVVWKRTFETMATVETITGKSLMELIVRGVSLKTTEVFSILRSVVPKEDLTDKSIKEWIAEDYQRALSTVADVLMRMLSDVKSNEVEL